MLHLRDTPRGREQQHDGVIGHLLDEYIGYVGDDNARVGRSFHIDHVHADACHTNNCALRQASNDVACDWDPPGDDNAVGVDGEFNECVARAALEIDDICDGLQRFCFGRRRGRPGAFGMLNDDLFSATHTALRRALPEDMNLPAVYGLLHSGPPACGDDVGRDAEEPNATGSKLIFRARYNRVRWIRRRRAGMNVRGHQQTQQLVEGHPAVAKRRRGYSSGLHQAVGKGE